MSVYCYTFVSNIKATNMKQNNFSNKNKSKYRIAAICIIIGALAMHFLSSPERWIRL